MKSKKSIGIIVIAVVLALAVIGVVALNVINSKVEEQIVSLLDEKIKENQLEDTLKYNEVVVAATKGFITINGLEFMDEETDLSIDSIELQIPNSEALKLAQDSSNANISDLKINLIGMNFSDKDGDIKLGQDKLFAHFKGNINTKIFNADDVPTDLDFTVNTLEMENSGVILTSDIGVISFSDLSIRAKGNLKASDFNKDYDELGYIGLIDIFDKINLNFEGFKYEAEQEIRQGLSMMAYMFLGEVSFIGNQENWAIDKLALEAGVEENTVSISNLELVTNWIDFNINASVTIDEALESFIPFNLKLRMNDYVGDLRPFFEMFTAEMTDEMLPEGNFALSFSMENENSYPEVKLEDLN